VTDAALCRSLRRSTSFGLAERHTPVAPTTKAQFEAQHERPELAVLSHKSTTVFPRRRKVVKERGLFAHSCDLERDRESGAHRICKSAAKLHNFQAPTMRYRIGRVLGGVWRRARAGGYSSNRRTTMLRVTWFNGCARRFRPTVSEAFTASSVLRYRRQALLRRAIDKRDSPILEFTDLSEAPTRTLDAMRLDPTRTFHPDRHPQ
jgi:hypothetical protein